MIESPEAMQEAILEFLQARFDAVPEEIADRIRTIRALKLKALIKHAAQCRDPEAFRKQLFA